MPYDLPESQFDAVEHASNRVLQANAFESLIVQQFKSLYHEFWGVTDPPTGSRFSVAEMQSILNAMPQSTAIDMMTDAAAFVVYIAAAYPLAMDAKYGTAAFNYTIDQNGITLTSLKADWETPEETP
jgi:hypothetical protein